MKKLLAILFIVLSLFLLTGQVVLAQPSVRGGRFLKRIEYNFFSRGIPVGTYNFNSKTDMETDDWDESKYMRLFGLLDD